MIEPLRFTLLGSPCVWLGDQPLTDFATNKAQALLFYLAVTALNGRPPHSRDLLANLLWDGMSDAQAKKNLRTILPDLRRLLGDYVQIERQTVAFDHSRPYGLDVAVLRRDLTPRPSPVALTVRQAAVDLYQGEFLSGFYVRDATVFEAWVLEQREQLHTLVVNALTELVNDYRQAGNALAALTANRRLLTLEPWSEPTHRQQMRLLAESGDRAAALTQYETCRRVLAAEFGIEALPETTALYEQIRADASSLRPPAAAPAPVAGVTRQADEPGAMPSATDPTVMTADASSVRVVGYNLPQRTKLYGRHAELARLWKWIGEEGCRLVGIFGIGGQGKTGLAAALVHELADALPTLPPMGATHKWRADGGGSGFTRLIWRSLVNAPP